MWESKILFNLNYEGREEKFKKVCYFKSVFELEKVYFKTNNAR